MSFPNYFPEDCPPKDAISASGTVYRMVRSPITSEDFISARQRNPNKNFPEAEKECKAHGVSVYREIKHAKRARKRSRALRGRSIGVGKLMSDHGVLKPTPSKSTGHSHCTWWVAVEIEPWKFFKIVQE